ncbi:MAG: 50S ribosomal protein L18 [Clostridiaceae bacterium]|nr:50S ribosomal protein L18 [Clostridiaceae bacterium]
MIKKEARNKVRRRKHARVRKNIIGTAVKPRLCVFRSNSQIYAQIIDDSKGVTLVSSSSLEKSIKDKLENGGNIEAAKAVGKSIGEKALAKGIKEVVFDRAGYIYRGRVAALADGAREAGLKF